MGRDSTTNTRGRAARVTAAALLLAGGLVAGAAATGPVRAATPGSGTVDGSGPVSWDFAPVGGPAGATDSYTLSVKLPARAAAYYAPDLRTGSAHAAVLTVTMTWAGSGGDQTYGLTAVDPTDSSGTAVGNDTLATTNDGSDVNVLTIQDPTAAAYTITASSQAGATSATVTPHAVAVLRLVDLAGQPSPVQPSGAPLFSTYLLPTSQMPITPYETNTLHHRAFGEPSVGVDPKTDAVMYQAGLYTMKATFKDTAQPAAVSWTNVSDTPLTSSASLDAILTVDRNTGRTLVSQLTAVCSLGAVSDDDGATWTPATKPCETPPAVDHETIGAGPFAAPLPSGPVYPDAAYYCSQNIAYAECALSVDGGFNYGAASPIYNSSQCFGLHGHVKVAPDGTVYVPAKACGAPECLIVTSTAGPNCHPGFAVSTNNGATWTVHTINDGNTPLYAADDSSIGIGANGTVYFGYRDRDGHAKVAVCTAQGTVCGSSVDVGAPFHVESARLASVVAGDDSRAAFSFVGSTTPGDDQQDSFAGTWHLYIATTYDGGKTWTTSDATPDKPIQRGCIEFAASCPNTSGTDNQRNLLDFNDTTLDAEGRVLVAYTDGCDGSTTTGHGSCINDATRMSGLPPEVQDPALARQSCGRTLFAAFDSKATPCAPATTVPEASRPAILAIGGAGVALLVAVGWRRRRRLALS